MRHTIRAIAWQDAPPDEVLRRVNQAVLRSGRATLCTALFAIVRRTPAGFSFEVASGGHPLPIVHRGSSGETATIGRPGTLLGVYGETRSFTVLAELTPGDTVVLYTDGVTDVRPPHDLTTEALEALVGDAAGRSDSATGVVKQLGRDVSAILPIAERNDDIALLVLKVAPT